MSAELGPPQPEMSRRVRAARAYAGLSANELAERIGLGLQTIKRIEAGKRNPRRYEIWAIAEACALPRAFFELDFELLCERAETLAALMERLDGRLRRIEAQTAANGAVPTREAA